MISPTIDTPPESVASPEMLSPTLPGRRLSSQPAAPAVRDLDPRIAGHLPALDGIRGLAIGLVTIYRFARLPVAAPGAAFGWGDRVVELGSYGVELFFVLSGFLITGILFDAKGQEGYFRHFYIRRTLRIFPLYYGVLLLFASAVWLAPSLVQGTKFAEAQSLQGWLWCYGLNVHQSLHNAWSGGAFVHFWSLAVEEHFYLAWPLVIFLCSRRTALWVCGGVMAGAIGLRIGLLALFGAEAGVAVDAFTLCRMDALAIGAWLALAARGPRGLDPLKPIAWGAGVCGALALAALFLTEKRLLTLGATAAPLLAAAGLYLALAAGRTSKLSLRLRHPLLIWLGKHSYGMYVFQLPLLAMVPLALHPAGLGEFYGSLAAGRVLFAAAMCLLTAAVAWLSWNAFEKRVLAWKDRLAPTRGARP